MTAVELNYEISFPFTCDRLSNFILSSTFQGSCTPDITFCGLHFNVTRQRFRNRRFAIVKICMYYAGFLLIQTANQPPIAIPASSSSLNVGGSHTFLRYRRSRAPNDKCLSILLVGLYDQRSNHFGRQRDVAKSVVAEFLVLG